MKQKYKTLARWSIAIWFILWGLLSVIIVSTHPIPPINYCILIAGFCMMFYCAYNEAKLFPEGQSEEEEKEEEQ